ncbi:ATP-dependent DNA helicase RecQ [Alkalibacillus flavidus]|uniref:ATP-dependent DNA helicase RecQ n=1 Tax=Alkalibacillus flavidus TaxID=546021 RepID=A0ABV2KUW1_9BACI
MADVNLDKALKHYFGFDSFRIGQEEIIESIMDGEHTLATLPTGSGKSVTYQLPAFVTEGLTIVVSPLISLMIDQVKWLKAKGIKRVASLTSMHTIEQKNKILTRLSQYKLLYCSPEMLQQDHVMSCLKQQQVSYFVIDEAHCLSQWGHEFRTDYLKLNHVFHALNEPTILALSATATDAVQRDIIDHFNTSFQAYIYPIDRPNIILSSVQVETMDEKHDELRTILAKRQVPTMIYFSSRQKSEDVCHMLQQQFPDRSIAYYHGGMTSEERLLIQQQFMYDQLDIICCTSAFGMGVDKANIRLVIHYHMPSDIESFIQEIGRAGRDGETSLSCLLYQRGDESLPFQLIGQELPDDDMIARFLADDPTIDDHLTETQHRFLNKQIEEKRDEKQMADRIRQTRDQRLVKKRQSVMAVLQWVHTEACRRESLYNMFQTNIQEPTEACCDHCDFTFDTWKPRHQTDVPIETAWQRRLNALFNRG